MPFHLAPDLRRFRRLTMGCPVVMGRKTFDSLPGGALPGRRNIVVTRNAALRPEGAETAPSLRQALEMAAGAERVFVIGGGEIYRQALEMAHAIELTEIDADAPGADTFFPETDGWHVAEDVEWGIDPKSGLRYRFVRLER